MTETFNPNQVELSFSDAAVKHVQNNLQRQPEKPIVYFSTKLAGCSGYTYVTELIEAPAETDVEVVADVPFKVYMQAESIQRLNHSTVDVKQKALGQTELIFQNPNATVHCGCGESFSVKG